MEETTNLKLPLLVPNQSQKEITHNEALVILDNLMNNGVKDKDLTTPPENPSQNDLYIVGVGATGEWEGKDNQLAFYDNGWRFCQARQGTKYWVIDENCIYVFNMTSWSKFSGGGSSGGGEGGEGGATSLSQLDDVSLTSISKDDILKFSNGVFTNSKELNNLTGLGINCEFDEDNKLMVKSDYVLFDNNGGDSKIKTNKSTTTQTASHLFQNNYSGRAEFGLIRNDDFSLKVSSDGSEWKEAFVVDKTTGNVDFKGNITKNGNNIATNNLELLQEININNNDLSLTFTGLDDGYKHIFDFFDLLSTNPSDELLAIFINANGDILISEGYNYYNICTISYEVDKNTSRSQSSTTISNLKISASLYESDMLSSVHSTYGYINFYNKSLTGKLVKEETSLFMTDFTTALKGSSILNSPISGIRFYLSSGGSFKSGKFKHYIVK